MGLLQARAKRSPNLKPKIEVDAKPSPGQTKDNAPPPLVQRFTHHTLNSSRLTCCTGFSESLTSVTAGLLLPLPSARAASCTMACRVSFARTSDASCPALLSSACKSATSTLPSLLLSACSKT